jgi:hypothetical protein
MPPRVIGERPLERPDLGSEPDAEFDPLGPTSFGIDELPFVLKLRPGT